MFSRSSNKFIPRSFPNFHCVGFVKSAHGLRGELYIQLSAKRADWLKSLNKLYLLSPGESSLKEWTVEFCRPHKDGLIAKVVGCVDRNHSETLRKSSVYISEDLLQAQEGEAIYLKQILGFEVFDRADKLGQIVRFASNGPQDLLEVQMADGREVLVPFVEAFIVKIDYPNKRVEMDLPPGLVDIEES